MPKDIKELNRTLKKLESKLRDAFLGVHEHDESGVNEDDEMPDWLHEVNGHSQEDKFKEEYHDVKATPEEEEEIRKTFEETYGCKMNYRNKYSGYASVLMYIKDSICTLD